MCNQLIAQFNVGFSIGILTVDHLTMKHSVAKKPGKLYKFINNICRSIHGWIILFLDLSAVQNIPTKLGRSSFALMKMAKVNFMFNGDQNDVPTILESYQCVCSCHNIPEYI